MQMSTLCKVIYCSMSKTYIGIKYVNVNPCKVSYVSMSGRNICIMYVNFLPCHLSLCQKFVKILVRFISYENR